MHRTKGEAILLRTRPLGEADRLVTLLHPGRGLVRLVAKSARRSKKRFLGSLESFTRLEVEFLEFPTGELGRLESAAVIAAFPRLRRELAALAQAAYACELAELVGRAGEPNAPLFEWLALFLHTVDARGPRADHLRVYELGLLDRSGFGPPLCACAACGKALDLGARPAFDTARGGALCPECSGPASRSVSLGTLRTLEASRDAGSQLSPRVGFSRQAISESRRLLGDFLDYHLERRPRSKEFLEQVCPEVC